MKIDEYILSKTVDELVQYSCYDVEDVCRLAQAALDLINTPPPTYFPDNDIDEPRVVEERGHGSCDVVFHGENRYTADEAIALGAAFMRTGLKAKESE